MPISSSELETIRAQWQEQWETALGAWSRFTKLASPRWCLTPREESAEHLSTSFAMIRLLDHAVVISLRQVRELKLQPFGVEIMAHEIGHHVYAPADLNDNARLLARIRMGLPTRESFSGLIANLYADLLINDRLQRSAGLDMSGVYKALRTAGPPDRMWALYLRIYEVLWSLPAGTLVDPIADRQVQSDAGLGARVIRVYAGNWLAGAGRFAALFLPYLLEIKEQKLRVLVLSSWLDTERAGGGDIIPDGLVEIDPDELDGAIHPSEDPELTGLEEEEKKKGPSAPREGGVATVGGRKNPCRSPEQYRELMKSIGVTVPEQDLLVRYYRELAVPYLVRFPVRETREAADPQVEGVDTWDTGMPIQEIDWFESLALSPQPIPGVTTVRRTYGQTEGHSPERVPLDLYIGIDCSGSMSNPAFSLSYPVLAGAVITLSALRAGARVMACLSGEPGRFSQTDGFLRDENEILKILTGYLGTGYSFGINRLEETFLKGFKPERPTHILIVSDNDIFTMLGELKGGWDIARDAVIAAGGGGTFVLEILGRNPLMKRMEDIGWNVHTVNTREELVRFAQAFSRTHYEQKKGPARTQVTA